MIEHIQRKQIKYVPDNWRKNKQTENRQRKNYK